MTIKDGVIEALEQENTDTEQFFERAWSVLEKQIIGTDSVDDIDAVSGATYSSNAIKNATMNALGVKIEQEVIPDAPTGSRTPVWIPSAQP